MRVNTNNQMIRVMEDIEKGLHRDYALVYVPQHGGFITPTMKGQAGMGWRCASRKVILRYLENRGVEIGRSMRRLMG